MTEGVIWKQLIDFAIPMAIGLLFQQLYNTADSVIVGKFVGKNALAAVGSTSSIINTLIGLCAGLSTGASVIISQHYGARDFKKLHEAVHTTIIVTLVLSVIATAAGILLIDPLLNLMATPGEVYGNSKTYLTIYFVGVAGLLIYNMGSGILRAVGDSRKPLLFLVFSALLNIALDLLFVITFGFGVAGAAYATILSQFISAILILITLSRKDTPYAIDWSNLRISIVEMKEIFRLGLPSGLQQSITSFSNVFVQSYINFYGSTCMAGWSGYTKLDVYVMIPVQSIALASTTFVGQNYGAGKLSRANEGVRKALSFSLVSTTLLCGLLFIFRNPLMTLFTDDPDVINFGARFISVVAPFYIVLCFNQIFAGALRGIGIARTPTIIMLGSFVFFRQLYLFVNKMLGQYFIVTALAYPMGWLLCSILMTLAYRRSSLFKTGSSIKINTNSVIDQTQIL
jgi:putative efflux protein, MATE family